MSNQGYYGQGPPGPPYQTHSPYPPQQGNYPPPQQHYPQQGYPQPPPMNNQYPPPQQGFGQPPGNAGFGQQNQGFGGSPYPPQQAPYGAPPPQQGFGQPPSFQQGQYGAPPPGPPQGFGQPPMGQYGPSSQPSPGYIPGQVAPMDMSQAADELRSAMKGIGTNEGVLIRVLPRLDPLQMASIRQAFTARHHRDLLHDLEKETSGYFREGLLALARGPLEQDAHTVHKAIKGAGTKETMLNDVLLGRSNADINAIKHEYHRLYHISLESDVQGDLSGKTERLFNMVLTARRAEESAPVLKHEIDADVQELYHATEGNKMGADQMPVCRILSSRSNAQIRKIAEEYQLAWNRSLEAQLRKSFSGHMQDALLYMLHAAEDRAKHDATLLEESMKGAGTKDELLVQRVVRVHWDHDRLQQCKAAYRHFFKKGLAERIKGETRGDYERLMVATVGEQ